MRAFLPSASQAFSFVTDTSLEMVGSAAVKVLRVFVLASDSAPVAARTASKLTMNTEYFVVFICFAFDCLRIELLERACLQLDVFDKNLAAAFDDDVKPDEIGSLALLEK